MGGWGKTELVQECLIWVKANGTACSGDQLRLVRAKQTLLLGIVVKHWEIGIVEKPLVFGQV